MLLLLMVVLMVVGLLTGVAGSSWKTIVQRSKEADLLFKGNQIRTAIGCYYEFSAGPKKASNAAGPKNYPRRLEDLLDDSRTVQRTKHLRRLYVDPMTGKGWALILDNDGQGIVGVRSTCTKKPFQQAGFSEENKNFSGKQSYRDWEFVYKPRRNKVE